jgi:hypothetical protein
VYTASAIFATDVINHSGTINEFTLDRADVTEPTLSSYSG